MSNADPTGTIGETPPLLQAARAAQDARIARITAETTERDAREIADLRERAVDLTAEILGVETEPEDWTPHRDADILVPTLRGILADVGGVTIFASRDSDRFRVELRPAAVDDDGFLVTSRFPIRSLADLPETTEEVERTLAEIVSMTPHEDADVEPDPVPTDEQTVDRLFSLDAARRSQDNGDLVGAVLYLAGRVDVLISVVHELRPRPINVEEGDATG